MLREECFAPTLADMKLQAVSHGRHKYKFPHISLWTMRVFRVRGRLNWWRFFEGEGVSFEASRVCSECLRSLFGVSSECLRSVFGVSCCRRWALFLSVSRIDVCEALSEVDMNTLRRELGYRMWEASDRQWRKLREIAFRDVRVLDANK